MGDSIHEESDPGPHDSTLSTGLGYDPGVLKIYEAGPLTVVGFAGKDCPDEVCIAAYRDQLMRLIDEVRCEVLAVDLTGVQLVPSGMLGLLTSLRKRVQRLELYNPSEDVRDVLRLTKLDQLFEIKNMG